ncbi:MAG: hypothetical protein NC079_08895 [Clostridium sp.]|nr:hypothetical protein [Acetatifactor muris]MCM1527763.1 hypothetical protein [Bacteroides sp.]MCM1563707.1 hypothetical protein [Clostridium sp.]
MQPLYTALKVNNEIELCELEAGECKKKIEHELLKNHISYYIRWPKTSIFSRRKNICIICINDNSRDAAEEIVRSICAENGFEVKFLMKHSPNHFL